MSYSLYITRAEHWFAPGGARITQKEWDNFVASHSEFSARNAEVAQVKNPQTGEIISMPVPATAVWTDSDGTAKAAFRYSNGNITTCSNSDEVIGKMRQVAALLRAKVQGAEGEWY